MKNVEVELEWRKCEKCRAPFKVMTTSKQKLCSIVCERYDQGAPQRGASVGENKRVSVTVSDTKPIPPSDKGKLFEARLGEWPDRKKNQTEAKKDTGQIAKPKLLENLNGREKTETTSRSTEGTTMRETSQSSESKSMTAVKNVTPPTDSTELSKTVVLVASPSMSLLDDTATHLHDLMKGLIGNRPPADVMTYDPERVNAACNCAKNIREIMKLKLEAMKFQKELS